MEKDVKACLLGRDNNAIYVSTDTSTNQLQLPPEKINPNTEGKI